MSNDSRTIAPLFGRIFMSLVFLFSGLTKIAAFQMMTGLAQAKGLPLPAISIAGAAAIEIFGGLAVLTGFQTKLAGWLLFLYLIPTTMLFHNFWALEGAERIDAQVHFFKNLAIMGGLLTLASFGAGAYSIDNRAARRT